VAVPATVGTAAASATGRNAVLQAQRGSTERVQQRAIAATATVSSAAQQQQQQQRDNSSVHSVVQGVSSSSYRSDAPAAVTATATRPVVHTDHTATASAATDVVARVSTAREAVQQRATLDSNNGNNFSSSDGVQVAHGSSARGASLRVPVLAAVGNSNSSSGASQQQQQHQQSRVRAPRKLWQLRAAAERTSTAVSTTNTTGDAPTPELPTGTAPPATIPQTTTAAAAVAAAAHIGVAVQGLSVLSGGSSSSGAEASMRSVASSSALVTTVAAAATAAASTSPVHAVVGGERDDALIILPQHRRSSSSSNSAGSSVPHGVLYGAASAVANAGLMQLAGPAM
jgi:hypothetical protein